jgi:hypothetical protein
LARYPTPTKIMTPPKPKKPKLFRYLVISSSLDSLEILLARELREMKASIEYSELPGDIRTTNKGKHLYEGAWMYHGVRKVLEIQPHHVPSFAPSQVSCLVSHVSPESLSFSSSPSSQSLPTCGAGTPITYIGSYEECLVKRKELLVGRRRKQILSDTLMQLPGVVDTWEMRLVFTSRAAPRRKPVKIHPDFLSSLGAKK